MKFDALMFIKHAHEGFIVEKNYCFFPFYPLFIRNFSKLFVEDLNEINLIFASLIFNFIVGIIGVVIFYKLSKEVLKNEIMSYKSTILWIINPALAFHASPYTATIFSTVTFFGFYVLF